MITAFTGLDKNGVPIEKTESGDQVSQMDFLAFHGWIQVSNGWFFNGWTQLLFKEHCW